MKWIILQVCCECLCVCRFVYPLVAQLIYSFIKQRLRTHTQWKCFEMFCLVLFCFFLSFSLFISFLIQLSLSIWFLFSLSSLSFYLSLSLSFSLLFSHSIVCCWVLFVNVDVIFSFVYLFIVVAVVVVIINVGVDSYFPDYCGQKKNFLTFNLPQRKKCKKTRNKMCSNE